MASDLPLFLFEDDQYTPDELDRGLCRGQLLVRVGDYRSL
jgi:hypothetical protein